MSSVASRTRRFILPICMALVLCLSPLPVAAAGYAALQGVKGLDTVFDVSISSPERALKVFPAIKGVHVDEQVRALPAPPRTVIVFRGPAVKLLTTDHSMIKPEERMALEQLVAELRDFKQVGIKLEVCLYAVNLFQIDPATILPEVDKVGNGFISVSGYQAQGYSAIRVQ